MCQGIFFFAISESFQAEFCGLKDYFYKRFSAWIFIERTSDASCSLWAGKKIHGWIIYIQPISVGTSVGILHFRRKKPDPAKTEAKILHFWRKKPDPAQTEAKILHFWRKNPDPAQTEAKILHFQRKKPDSAQTGAKILHFRRKRSDSAQTGAKILHFQRKKPDSAQTEVKFLHYERKSQVLHNSRERNFRLNLKGGTGFWIFISAIGGSRPVPGGKSKSSMIWKHSRYYKQNSTAEKSVWNRPFSGTFSSICYWFSDYCTRNTSCIKEPCWRVWPWVS